MTSRLRKSVHRLDDAEVEALITAFAALSASEEPAGNYTFWASIHTHCCPHRNAVFLPWHRAYIYAFEDALRASINSQTLTLPYWDWIEEPAVPALVEALRPEAERYTDEMREQLGLRLPRYDEIQTVMGLETFARFGGGTCSSIMGGLENKHGLVHTWVGPVMAEAKTAAFDPVFWLHHSNVDRLWARWQVDHPGAHPPCPTRVLDGVPGDWIIEDVKYVSSPRLEYDYAEAFKGPAKILFDRGVARVRIPVADARATTVVFDGISIEGEGPPPAELVLVAATGGAPLPAISVSLFGLHHRRSAVPQDVQIPGCGQHHHGHDGHATLHVDLIEWASVLPSETTVELQLELRGSKYRYSATIDRITVLERHAG